MNKIFSKGQLVVFGMMLLVIITSIIIKICTKEIVVRASVSPLNIEAGGTIRYCDSTSYVSDVFWEFGNGDCSREKLGHYTFRKVGRYQVRLTVDKKIQTFFVDVREPKLEKDKQLVQIIGPSVSIQNEKVVFLAHGDGADWRWSFGESGTASQERNVIYSFPNAGTFEVKLKTSNMMYAVTHKIKVIPESAIDINKDSTTGKEPTEDFMEKLQLIIDKRTANFNKTYNYLVSKYLNNNTKTPVLINGSKDNDFDTYCHNLNILGKQQCISITEVNFEYSANDKIKRVLVSQASVE